MSRIAQLETPARAWRATIWQWHSLVGVAGWQHWAGTGLPDHPIKLVTFHKSQRPAGHLSSRHRK
jgi:hypothetical protein